jgi:uncharacterized protein YcbK (DUF882 family)
MKNYFSEAELSCSCCGSYHFAPEFLYILNVIREQCGFPLPVTSGYRCPKHPVEARKRRSGAHSRGLAVDIGVRGESAHRLVEAALTQGVPRIGIQQKGEGRFIHLDIDSSMPNPTIWSY